MSAGDSQARDPGALADVAPFAAWLGIEEISIQTGEVCLQLAQRQELNNRRGVVHGGVLATLVDSAMARSVRTLGEGVELHGTTDLHVQFLQPASGRLTATARVESAGRTLAFCRAEVHDGTGQPVACAMATLRLHRPR